MAAEQDEACKGKEIRIWMEGDHHKGHIEGLFREIKASRPPVLLALSLFGLCLPSKGNSWLGGAEFRC
jgi:hypothetical protein